MDAYGNSAWQENNAFTIQNRDQCIKKLRTSPDFKDQIYAKLDSVELYGDIHLITLIHLVNRICEN